MLRKFGKWALTGIFAFVFMSIAGAAGLTVLHTAFPNADTSTEFGIPSAVESHSTILQTNMISKTVVTNNASAAYQVPSSNAYVIFAGTNVANLTVSMPSAANSFDSQEVSIMGVAATSSVTVTSSGATVTGNPSTPTSANWHAKYKYDVGTLTWYAVDN